MIASRVGVKNIHAYANAAWCQGVYICWGFPPGRHNTLETFTGYTWNTSSSDMVKIFSVDWLAKSYHDSKQDPETVETSQAPLRRHVPCLVQPRPPTSYDKVYIQPKLKGSRIEESTSTEEQKDKEGIVFTHSAQRNCTSPSCKYLHYLIL